jgi:hypothetical protein
VLAILLGAGDHVPVIPLVDVVGKVGNGVLIQIGAIAVKVGVTGAVIGTDKVAVLAHCPAFGVNVYVVVAALLNAGDHVPLIPLVDVDGNGLVVVPAHKGVIAAKVGVVLGVITICNVVVVAHWLAFGVNV